MYLCRTCINFNEVVGKKEVGSAIVNAKVALSNPGNMKLLYVLGQSPAIRGQPFIGMQF